MNSHDPQAREVLRKIAHRVMGERGLLADFSAAVTAELAAIQPVAANANGAVRDLRNLLWASIDNDDSRDLDQLSVAEPMPGGCTRVLVAVADVNAVLRRGSAIDEHAQHNTTSVYTAAVIFPMLPEKLSTDITSLNFHDDRPAIVIDMVIGPDGGLQQSDIYRAWVRNQAKLAYDSVAAWLDGGQMPAAVAAVPGLDANLRLQDEAAQRMMHLRQEHGALTFESIEARAVFEGDSIRDLRQEKPNRAKHLIEDFMVSANGVTARYLAAKKFPSLRRVVRTPRRWEGIVELAARYGVKLPAEPDAGQLNQFLVARKAADPLRFPDLSLAVIKLMGPGEYMAEIPGETAPTGHFGLAVADYSHSTAPNRRYPDVITHRLLKAALAGEAPPYGKAELEMLARHCTSQEDAAKKVERQVGKSAAAMLLVSRIGERFDAIVPGAADKGTWVRVLEPPVDGKLVQGFQGMKVGDRLHVELVHANVEQGFIDFKKVG